MTLVHGRCNGAVGVAVVEASSGAVSGPNVQPLEVAPVRLLVTGEPSASVTNGGLTAVVVPMFKALPRAIYVGEEPPREVLPPRVVVDDRPWDMDFSLVAQMDGIMYSILGIRIERDVLAPSAADSVCPFFGRASVEPLTAFCGFYFGDPEAVAHAVAQCVQQHAVGTFVVPIVSRCSVMVGKQRSTPWMEYLMTKAKLVFVLPRAALTPRASWIREHGPLDVAEAYQVVVASFGCARIFKSKRRPERDFVLETVAGAYAGRRTLGTLPWLQTRVSPMAGELGPTGAADTMADSRDRLYDGPFDPGIVNRPSAPPRWDVRLMSAWSVNYPHPRVRELALQAVDGGVDPFVGDVTKTVAYRPSQGLTEEVSMQCRAALMKEVAKGNTEGPFESCPYAATRVCTNFGVPKNKHDLANPLLRLISNFAKGGTSSVNALCWSPKLISAHCNARWIRDRIAECGRTAVVWAADIPSCFRRQRICSRLLHLFVYVLRTKEFGVEYFADLSCPFGWTPSEWSWQCILAMLLWFFNLAGLDDLLAYVDNFFLIQPEGPAARQRELVAVEILQAAGVELHEYQTGPVFDGLGWQWDVPNLQMRCPTDKYVTLCAYLADWSERCTPGGSRMFTMKEVRRCIGLLRWLSAGFSQGRTDMPHLVHAMVSAQAGSDAHERRFRHASKAAEFTFKLSTAACGVILFWHEFFPLWDRCCPIRQGFSPTASWQGLGRVDASTRWGCGGFLLLEGSLLGFMHEWTPAERIQGMGAGDALRRNTSLKSGTALDRFFWRVSN